MFRKCASFSSLALVLCLLTGCATFSSAEARIYTGQKSASPSAVTTTARVQDLTKTFTSSAQIVFRSTKEVCLEADGVTFVESKVTIGQKVQKGDVLAVFSGSSTAVQRTEYELSIEEAENELSDTLASYDKSIAKLQEELDDLKAQQIQYTRTVIDEEILQKRIDKLLLQKEQAQFRAEKQISDLRSAIEELENEEEKLTVTSPIDGVVSSVDYLSSGAVCYAGQHIATIYRPEKALLYASGSFSGTLRYGQIVSGTFSYGPKKVEVTGLVVSCDDLLPDQYDFGGALILPLNAENIEMLQGATEQVRGLSFSMTATDISLPQVLTVSKDTLQYNNNTAYVYVLENGVSRKSYVQTGVSDGKSVMILSGLSDGDTVLLN